MLIRVSNGTGGWRVFDKVEEYEYDPKRYTLKKPEDASQFFSAFPNVRSLVPNSYFENNQPVDVSVIQMQRVGGIVLHVVFIGVIYICNDHGDTLDKIDPTRGNQERKRR